MNDSTSVNDLSQITRIVAGGEYSVDDIPIAHVRDGRIFVWPTFQSIFSYMDVGGMNEVYDINRAEFFSAYYSVCRGKRDSNTVSARWVQRCNILHISDNHATNEDGYSNLREAISIANAGEHDAGCDSQYGRSDKRVRYWSAEKYSDRNS